MSSREKSRTVDDGLNWEAGSAGGSGSEAVIVIIPSRGRDCAGIQEVTPVVRNNERYTIPELLEDGWTLLLLFLASEFSPFW